MALGIPNLDQITQTLDSISGSFDSNSDMLKIEWSNPTIDQLDSWGNILNG